MRVLLVDVNYKQGSTGKIVYNLYKRLNSDGIETAVCYGRGKKTKDKNVFKFGVDFETLVHAFLTRITGYTGCFSFFSTKRLINFINKFNPDVVHLHELHAYFLNITTILSFLKKKNVKVIHTLHCTFSYTGKCGHHLDCQNWKHHCGKCPQLRAYVSTLFFDHTKHMFLRKKEAFDGFSDMTIVCPSKWLANYAKESFLGQYKIEVIPNGIDTSIFYPRNAETLRKKMGFRSDVKIVLSVAPNLMSETKGGNWVVELAKLLINEKIVFVLIGVDNLDRPFPPNVIAFKRTSNQDDLATFYSLADIFVICSKIENYPTTCLEAQCCGTPVCGFDVGGVKETSIYSENAFFDYGDLESLKNYIIKKESKALIGIKKEYSSLDMNHFYSLHKKIYTD